MSKVVCGVCDFNATMEDESTLAELYENHTCISDTEKKWYNSTIGMILIFAAFGLVVYADDIIRAISDAVSR